MFAKEFIEDFNRNTTCKEKDGRWNFDCKKGLWGVSGTDLAQTIDEAYWYFAQYQSDGEYNNGE